MIEAIGVVLKLIGWLVIVGLIAWFGIATMSGLEKSTNFIHQHSTAQHRLLAKGCGMKVDHTPTQQLSPTTEF